VKRRYRPQRTVNDIRRAIDAAAGALKNVCHGYQTRQYSAQAGHLILQQEKELANLLTREQGKPMRESILEIRRFVHTFDHYGEWRKA
jgi:succinate-semialdehyde dehydrogenase/glutarate-semialdehyde dehydrogenase